MLDFFSSIKRIFKSNSQQLTKSGLWAQNVEGKGWRMDCGSKGWVDWGWWEY
jgi:hypothetical protein